MSRTPSTFAVSIDQKLSLAEFTQMKKYARYQEITEENLSNYHAISCYPITKRAEADMELVSDLVTWGERYLNFWGKGSYCCSRCNSHLYRSEDKYKGPCVWPSFRKSIDNGFVLEELVYPYNSYEVAVMEIYCGTCKLFIGHKFEDAVEKGDTHPRAHWRH